MSIKLSGSNRRKVDPREGIYYGTNIIAPKRKQLIYNAAKEYFEKFHKEKIKYYTFYISKGFSYKNSDGKTVEVPKLERQRNPKFKTDSSKWRRIDYLPKDWRIEMRLMVEVLGLSINPRFLHGFLPARSVITAGKEIAKANTVVEVDAKDAFHQMTRREIFHICRRLLDWNEKLSKWWSYLLAPTGVAQMGNPVVPLFWNIKVAIILRKVYRRLRRAGITAIPVSYADDICFLSDEERMPRQEIDTIECIIGNYLRLNKKKTKIRHKSHGFHKLGLTIHPKGITTAYKYKRLHRCHLKYALNLKGWYPKYNNGGKWDQRMTIQNNIWGNMEWITNADHPGDKSAKVKENLRLCRRFDLPYVPTLVVPK